MPKRITQQGFFHIGIIIAIFAFIISAFLVIYFKSNTKPTPDIAPAASSKPAIPQATSAPKTTATPARQAAKNDLEALGKYCKQEALKLPEVPFTYQSKSGPTTSGPMPWIDQFIPKDKRQSEKKSCTMVYSFDGRAAYGEMGAKYPGESRIFNKAVRAGLASKLDSSWEKVTGPNISNDGFNMVYKRENTQMGTVDFMDAFDGGLVIYVKFNTYYK